MMIHNSIYTGHHTVEDVRLHTKRQHTHTLQQTQLDDLLGVDAING